MAITDASGNVDTTWTEQDTVAFIAGTLATVSEMICEVQDKIQRGTLSGTTTPSTTQVQNWLIRGKEELAEIKNFTWSRRYAYATTAASTWRYSLPPDYHGGEISLRDTTNDKRISIWPAIAFDNEYPDPSGEDNNIPGVACIKGNELWLNCPANGTYQYELEYNRSGDDNTTNDFSYLPEIDRYRVCDFAVFQSFLLLHQWDAAKFYADQWGFDMQKAKKADGKKKWSNMDYHCILWFS